MMRYNLRGKEETKSRSLRSQQSKKTNEKLHGKYQQRKTKASIKSAAYCNRRNSDSQQPSCLSEVPTKTNKGLSHHDKASEQINVSNERTDDNRQSSNVLSKATKYISQVCTDVSKITDRHPHGTRHSEKNKQHDEREDKLLEKVKNGSSNSDAKMDLDVVKPAEGDILSWIRSRDDGSEGLPTELVPVEVAVRLPILRERYGLRRRPRNNQGVEEQSGNVRAPRCVNEGRIGAFEAPATVDRKGVRRTDIRAHQIKAENTCDIIHSEVQNKTNLCVSAADRGRNQRKSLSRKADRFNTGKSTSPTVKVVDITSHLSNMLEMTPPSLRSTGTSQSGSDSSTPVWQSTNTDIQSGNCEDLFGFERMIHTNQSAPKDLSFCSSGISPIRMAENSGNISATRYSSKVTKSLSAKYQPWQGLLNTTSPQRTKRGRKNPGRTRSTEATNQSKERLDSESDEIHLFGEGSLYSDENTVCTKNLFSTFKTQTNDMAFGEKDQRQLKQRSSTKIVKASPRKKRKVLEGYNLVLPEIPWQEIMDHELVIE